MKKILHLQLLPLLSGVQRFSLHLLAGLDKQEFDIWVACKPGGEFPKEILSHGYHYYPLPTFCHAISFRDFFTFLHLIWLIKKERFDIVHTNSSKPGFLGRLAARLCKVPLIIHTAHGTPFQTGQAPLQYAFYVAMEYLGNHLGHQTIFVNNSDRLNCLSMGLVSKAKARTIFNAIPPTLAKQLQQLSAKRSLPQGDIVIGSTLRFSTQKNVINLVSTACRACQKAPRLKFIILGDGEHYQLCQALVHSFGLSSRVLLPGWDSDVIPWLKSFDAFVLYSRWEAQPFSIIEAMSSGLALIGSAIPSLQELSDDSTGYLIPLDNNKALEDLFVRIAEDFAPVFQNGQNAATHINALCNYQAMVSAYREVYLGS